MAQYRTPTGMIAKREYNHKYNLKNYDTISSIRPPKGTKDRWKEFADKEGLSMSQFVIKAVEEYVANHKEV